MLKKWNTPANSRRPPPRYFKDFGTESNFEETELRVPEIDDKGILEKKYNKKIQRRLPPLSDGPKFPRIKKSPNQIPGLFISWQDWKDNHCCCCSQLLLKLLPLWPKIWGKKSLDICLQKVIFRCFFYSCRTEKKCPVQNESTVLFCGINLKTLDLVTPLLLLEQLLGLK